MFTDEDGDDKPDNRKLLFTQAGRPQDDHSTHSFVFGPDGKLYWNMGNNGGFVHDANGKLIVDTAGNHVLDRRQMGRFKDARTPYWGGMIFRCNPDGSEFEVLGHNFRNNYEVAVDSLATSGNRTTTTTPLRRPHQLHPRGWQLRLPRGTHRGRLAQAPRQPGGGCQLTALAPERPGRVPNFVQTGAGSRPASPFTRVNCSPKFFTIK